MAHASAGEFLLAFWQRVLEHVSHPRPAEARWYVPNFIYNGDVPPWAAAAARVKAGAKGGASAGAPLRENRKRRWHSFLYFMNKLGLAPARGSAIL